MFRLPDSTQRIAIVGRTGTGKTVGGVRHLSQAPFTEMPYVIYDFKRDNLLAKIEAIEGSEEIGMDFVPKKPGLYFVHPHPDDLEPVKLQMRKIWEQENVGVFIDEGYMVCGQHANNPPFRSLLTQGRSKHIPMIILSQRPVWMDRFVFSESDFFQVFDLNHSGDRKKIMEYVPADLDQPLLKYHSYYHDVAEKETYVMKPGKNPDELLEVFDRRLAVLRKKPSRLRAI